MKRSSLFILIMVTALLLAPMIASAAPAATNAASPAAAPGFSPETPVKDAPDAVCALLDDAKVRATMSGMFETKLLLACGRENELGGVTSDAPASHAPTFGTDVLVNDPALDSGPSRTQSETSIARSETTGTICSAYNDSYSGVTAGTGYSGFSRSTDDGATFSDRGALGSASFGDTSMFWRKSDGKFYVGTLHSAGIGLWRSDDDCQTMTFVGNPHVGSGDDKELFAVDNNIASPYYGRIYMAWINFNAGARIFAIYSDNGTTWSAPLAISASGADVQGAWPAVAPNGDVYVSWVRWNPYSTGPIDIEVVRSTNGGTSFVQVTNPLTGGINPRAAGPTSACARPALNGNIRYLPSPQITVSPNGDLHVVYVRDPDGLNVGDVINVYYRRSTDNGATWEPEVLLNDDGTTTDQFFPTISAGPGGRIVSTWYDRRLDTANNLLFDYYMRASDDGGVTWQPSVRVTDGSSGVVLDPNLATCYHGDYDQQMQTASSVLVQWSDDRQVVNGTDPNVYFDTQAFSPDYVLDVTPASVGVCAPADAVYTVDIGSVLGYSDPVTLSTTSTPAGATVNFGTNPVNPPGSSTLTIGTGAVAAGNYAFDVNANSTSGSKSKTVGLDVFTAAPAAATLLTPANGAINVPQVPTFTWSAVPQAASYSIEVATDAAFTNVVASASGLTGTSYSGASLNTSTTYYWRLWADNTCGTGAYSATWSFTTEAAPGDCGPGSTPNILFSDDFESGASGWTTPGGIGANTWALGAGVSGTPHSGSFVYHADDVNTVSEQFLVSPAVALPTGQNPVTLKFWNYQEMEDGGASCYDGGLLEVSTNGGGSWTQVPDGDLLTDPYDGPIDSGFSNPRAGDLAWCGDPQPWLNSIVDVSAYAGQTVQFRWVMATDSSVSHPGWDVDDVLVQSCEVSGGDPNIDVNPLSLFSSQETNTTTNQPLIVANTGGGTLDWTIDEEAVILPSAPGAAPRSAAAADTGSRDGSAGGPAPIVYNSPADFSEGFDDITLLPGQGWFFQNNSEPLGVTDWFQGNDGVFPSQAGATTAYIAANFNNSGSPGTISNWMLTPEMSMSDGDTLSFWTRTVTGSTFPDRLQVRLSTAGSSTNVGVGANDVGDFTTLLLDINPSLLQGGYPDDWAQYTITLSGLPGGMADGRVAWRYFVTDAGPTGANSNYIGIDTVEYVAGMAEPCTALADIPWLSVSPANGSNGGGTNTNVTATFNSTGLADGVYTGNLCITSNDPDAGPGNGTDLVIVPVTLTVLPPTAVALTGLSAGVEQMPAPLAGLPLATLPAAAAAALGAAFVWRRKRDQ